VLVEGALIYSIIRYRDRPGMPMPKQTHGNNTLELLWTVIPAIILFIVLIFTIRGLLQVAPEQQPTGKRINIRAVGHQWWWEFYYEDYKITTADSLHIPAGTVIHVDLYSNNVIHSFWVPKLTGKTDVIPGHDNIKWFEANSDTVGKTYLGICAEYCGTQHTNMRFDVVVDSADGFNTWVSTQQQAATTPTAGLAAQGAKIFAAQCTSCHGIVGVDLQKSGTAPYGDDDPKLACNAANAKCLVGPNLTHFGSRHLIAGGVLAWDDASCDPNDPNLLQHCNLAKWLNDPQGIKPGTDMSIGPLSKEQLQQLVAYLESLK